MNKQAQYSLLRHYLMSKESFFTLESASDATEEEKKLIRAARKALEKTEASGRSFAAYDVEGDLLKDEKPSKKSFFGGMLGSSDPEPQVLEDVPSIDDFDPMTEDYDKALSKYWKQKGYSDVRRHDYAPSGTPYTMMGPDGKYYEASMDENLGKWTITPLGGSQHDGAEHPDDLPDTYNRTGPGLARQKESGYSILRRHLMQKIAEECAACGMDEAECDCEECKAASEAWTRSEGKNPEGGLNAKGRASYNKATGGNLKAPVSSEAADKSPAKAKRRSSFCSRMCGMKAKRTGSETSRDPDSRINKALRKWDCSC